MEKGRPTKLLVSGSQAGISVTAYISILPPYQRRRIHAPTSTEVHVKSTKTIQRLQNPVQIPRGTGHPASFSTNAAG